LLHWSGIQDDAFWAAYAVLADRQQQQQTNKPISRLKDEIKPQFVLSQPRDCPAASFTFFY